MRRMETNRLINVDGLLQIYYLIENRSWCFHRLNCRAFSVENRFCRNVFLSKAIVLCHLLWNWWREHQSTSHSREITMLFQSQSVTMSPTIEEKSSLSLLAPHALYSSLSAPVLFTGKASIHSKKTRMSSKTPLRLLSNCLFNLIELIPLLRSKLHSTNEHISDLLSDWSPRELRKASKIDWIIQEWPPRPQISCGRKKILIGFWNWMKISTWVVLIEAGTPLIRFYSRDWIATIQPFDSWDALVI